MSRRESSNCHRCAAVLRPGAELCSACCASRSAVGAQPFHVPSREPVVAAPDVTAQTGLSAWPFGQADAEAAAQVAAKTIAADVHAELSHYSAQSSTTVLTALPAQRTPQPAAEMYSVPSTGPNPFLAAARLQQVRDEAAADEGYPV